MTIRLSLALCLLAVTPALAQPKAAPAAGDDTETFKKEIDALFSVGGLTADQAAKRARRVSPTVLRRAAELDAAIASRQAAQLARVPQARATVSYTRLSKVEPLMFGPGMTLDFPSNSTAMTGTLGVPLSDYLVRIPKLIDAAKLAEQVSRTNMHASEVDAGHEARLAYFEWMRARLQVLVAQRQQAQVQAVLKQVRALAEAQRLSKADLMRIESQDAEAARTVDQLTKLTILREEQVRLLIGAPETEKLALGEDPRTEVPMPAAASLDELVQRAKRYRLEFRIIDLGIAAREKQRESEKSNLFPHLSAFAQLDYANPNQRIFPLIDKFKATWQAGVQLQWTLNETLLANTNDHRLAAETNELRADRENLLRGTRIEVLAAQQGVLLAQESIVTSMKGLLAAEESYRVRRELLSAERATTVELVDAETDLNRARIAAVNARVDLRVALAQLAHALGEDTAQGGR